MFCRIFTVYFPKMRDIIQKNCERKLTKNKKLPNNRIIEIDNCSPLELLKLQKNLVKIADGELFYHPQLHQQ